MVHNLTLVVDAGGARDVDVAAVTVVDIRSAFKRHTIVARAIEVGRGIEVVNLFFLDSGDGISIHLRKHLRVGLASTDACAGNEMRAVGEVLRDEHLVACLHNTIVVQVYIVHEEPCADAVVGQRTTFADELHHVVVEQDARLAFRVLGVVASRGEPEVAEVAVAGLIKST